MALSLGQSAAGSCTAANETSSSLGKRIWKRGAGSGSVESSALGRVILWLSPPSPPAISAGAQLSLRVKKTAEAHARPYGGY